MNVYTYLFTGYVKLNYLTRTPFTAHESKQGMQLVYLSFIDYQSHSIPFRFNLNSILSFVLLICEVKYTCHHFGMMPPKFTNFYHKCLIYPD